MLSGFDCGGGGDENVQSKVNKQTSKKSENYNIKCVIKN